MGHLFGKLLHYSVLAILCSEFATAKGCHHSFRGGQSHQNLILAQNKSYLFISRVPMSLMSILNDSICKYSRGKYSTAWYIPFIRDGTSVCLLHVKFNPPLNITRLLRRALKVQDSLYGLNYMGRPDSSRAFEKRAPQH